MPEQDQENENSVFDFLYVDHERIGLYISQLNEFGSLTSLVRTAETSGKKDFKGKIPAMAEMSGETASRTSATRSFDPRWTQCLEFMDELQERDMINRSVAKAAIGQFVLGGGDLAIIDIGSLQRFLKHPAVQAMARKGANPEASNPGPTKAQRKHGARSGGGNQGHTEDEMAAGFEIVGEVSHSVHARMSAGHDHLWCTLKPECMVMSSADVMLKYGVLVEGTWHVLGILDAVPGGLEDQIPALAKMFPPDPNNSMLTASVEIFTKLRFLLGRPVNCHGVTPLAIFRKIERQASP